MSQPPPQPSRRRRAILRGAAAIPAAAVAAEVAAGTPNPPLSATPEQAEEVHRGYHETDHIRTYYRLAGLM
jgi:hypothetical protein